MKKKYILLIVLMAALCVLLSLPEISVAGDLDDKIGSYTDDSIEADHNMGDPSMNIKYKKMDAKSKAKVRQKAKENQAKAGHTSKSKKGKGDDSSASINSVNMGAGANVKGDIIIIDESKGGKTAIADR